MGPIQSWPSIRRPASSAWPCSRTGSASARCARGRGRDRRGGDAVGRRARVRAERARPPAERRQRPAGARRAAGRRPARGRPPGRGDRRPRRRRRPHRQGLHRARRPRDRRAPQLPGQHDGPRHRPAGDVRRVRGRHRRLQDRLLAALDAAEGAGRRRARAPVGGDGRRPADGEPWRRTVDLRVEDHDAPLEELRRLLTLQRAYDLAGAGDELLAAGRTDEAGELYTQAARARPELRRAAVLVRPGDAPRRATSKAASPRYGGRPRRTRTGWSSSTGSHRNSLRRARRCVSR